MFRRGRTAPLESAQQALAQGQYDLALTMLETAARRAARQGQGQAWLHLAALYALYGEDGIENGAPALRSAVASDPNLAVHPLYKALFWEFAAYRDGSVGDVKRGVKDVPLTDPVASYHAASALFVVDAPKSASRRLAAIEEDQLPAYLLWRRWSLLGQCREALGEWEGAAEAFTHAVAHAPPAEREPERLSLAGSLVELGRTHDAVACLGDIAEELLRPEELTVHRYLLGRAHLELGNPNRALELLADARSTASGDAVERSEPNYSVAFATAQALTSLGRYAEAKEEFARALGLAPAEHRAYTQHEAAYALIECDDLTEAEVLLVEVVSDPSYPHRGEALADLADVRLRSGEFESAQVAAEQALELGASAAACLTLGNIAYEYYRLDDAVSWFEQAVGSSHPGDPYWVSAHQMLADVYAQMGEGHEHNVLLHAKAALDHTEASSEWFLPLKRYVEGARSVLGGHDRLLN